MLKEVYKLIGLFLISVLICVIAYNGFVLIAASIVVPAKSQGSLIIGSDGNVVGARLIGQAFTKPEYLWPRPSAVDYNAGGAGGSNLSPANPKIRDRAEKILSRYEINSDSMLPAELVTASGSGLDPHITLEGALIQAERIAKSRHQDVEKLRDQMREFAKSNSGEGLALNGLINVLEFNMALDSKLDLVEKR